MQDDRWPTRFRLGAVKELLIWAAMLLPLVGYGSGTLRRPAREAIAAQPLFQGITYSRRIQTQPRPLTVHLLEIDLTATGLKPFSTPGFEGSNPNTYEPIGQETLAQRTTDFLATHQLQVAINANFFYPFREETLWNYEPRSGQPVNMGGTAISNGELVSLPQPQRPSLCFLEQRAVIVDDGFCFVGTQQAVSGNTLLLAEGQVTPEVQEILADGQPAKPYPVNIAALDATGTKLWLILADGKQPLYSEGMTLAEVTALLQELGVSSAVRLDGGGSTTLAIDAAGPRLVNAVIHAKVPGQERPVANHLGFFADSFVR